jgi:hypothetical protein
MVISDTHEFKFGDAEIVGGQFKHPLPKCDVLLHCGDLTELGTISEYKDSLRMLGQIDAELKLVIAGNHDLSLDKRWWAQNGNTSSDPTQTHDAAVEMWTGPSAKKAGVTYLEEGLHSFTLKSSATITVYASPYQPEYCGYAFPYERNEDRFNPPDEVMKPNVCITKHPIPSFPRADIVMTHGPPQAILDWTEVGNVGCQHLARALERARPRLCCFGHIHEGYGARLIGWTGASEAVGETPKQPETLVTNPYPLSLKLPISFGKETLMVNAAIMNILYKPTNAPWLVDLDLELAKSPLD